MRDDLMSERIFIIDIDGCIIENIYPNFDEKRISLEEVKNRLLQKDLYQEFWDFLYYVINPDLDGICFITGRKKSELGSITEIQLNKIKNMQIKYCIIFYPEKLEITSENYFNFKIDNCNHIIKNNWSKNIFIIDDKDDYFKNIEYRCNVKGCFKIKNKHSWHDLKRYLKN